MTVPSWRETRDGSERDRVLHPTEAIVTRSKAASIKSVATLLAMVLLASGGIARTALAALPVGATAPDFELQAARGGKSLDFKLQQALKRGPVVLYFFPAAFTTGCTIEAHDFADATDAFNRMGATVIGVTAGNVERVTEFSKVACRDKFAVAADPGAKIAARYDALMDVPGRTLSNRTSFVIAPDGKILLSYTDGDPDNHIQKALDAVKGYRDRG